MFAGFLALNGLRFLATDADDEQFTGWVRANAAP